MYVHGVSGEIEVTHTSIKYFLKDQGAMLEMNRTKKLEFYQCVTKSCSGYNHPPKFWPTPILEPPLKGFN